MVRFINSFSCNSLHCVYERNNLVIMQLLFDEQRQIARKTPVIVVFLSYTGNILQNSPHQQFGVAAIAWVRPEARLPSAIFTSS